MLEITFFFVIILVYVIPLNFLFFNFADKIARAIINSQSNFILLVDIITTLFYILFILVIFILIYLFLRYIVLKLIYVFFNIEIDAEKLLAKYSRGQRNLNMVAKGTILLILLIHLFLGNFDIRIFVFGLICMLFIFKLDKANEPGYYTQK